MAIATWIRPSEWSAETKEAAKTAAKMAVLFALAVLRDSRSRNEICQFLVEKLPPLIKKNAPV